MNLLSDIILIIIQLLPVPDTRNLLRCDKKTNLLASNKIIASIIDINSLNWENKLNNDLVTINPKFINYGDYIWRERLSECEKYTFEIICYGYIHLLSKRYMFKYNGILCNYTKIYIHIGYNNFLDLIKFLSKNFNTCYYYILEGAAINGNLKIYKLVKGYGYIFSYYDWANTVKAQQLPILKWAKNNGYNISALAFDYAIQNKYLDILKWANKNNYIDANIYMQVILNN